MAFGYCHWLHVSMCECWPRACLCIISSPIQDRTNKFGQKKQNTLFKVFIVLVVDWHWFSRWNLNVQILHYYLFVHQSKFIHNHHSWYIIRELHLRRPLHGPDYFAVSTLCTCFFLIYPSHNEVVGGYIGFTPSVRPSVHPSRIPRPLCSAYSSSWIHFIFIVRRAGLLWSQQDFEWLWSVPLSSASLY